ncbi:phosphotransferase family protein [Pseudalkalibacillus caeni]|uniref:Phosphotransferase family protein n=1 Tax=Exobacillus caeni TaxID=2574798 RepID=A0A5R9FCT1_9BACL|nr:phosphotransferase family protein [Pseudalkalibacillus caeni]TLS38364.1 phosphotransferase family protein [Pseudalkalibacillus caeni]
MKETIPVRQGEELNEQKLEQFIGERLGIDGDLLISQFPSGHSNLTYLLTKGDWEAVLRRPPLGPVAAKAHDMERESNFLNKLHPVFPLAPKPYLFSKDESIIGSPFFIMERRRGVVLDTELPEDMLVTEELGKRISTKMVETLAALHAVDYKEAGLEEMTRPEGFLERQVYGWIKRYEKAKTDEVEGVEQLTNWLKNNLPQSGEAAVIHYDYKLNNMMFDHELEEIVGIFDWEMSTVGDPLADLGCAMGYWTQEDDPDFLKYGMGKPSLTVNKGFFTRQEFIEAYAAKSGRDVSDMPFYLTFAYFKLAVICQQIYYRYKKGQTNDSRFERMGEFVKGLITFASYQSQERV